MIIFRSPTKADIEHVAANMREADALECRVVGGVGPFEGLKQSVDSSDWAFAADVDGEVICIFGVARESLLSDDGSPWMLGTHGIERHARIVLRYSVSFRDRMKAEFKTLANIVHAHNLIAIRYLKWCGFSLGDQFVVKGEPFMPFEMSGGAS